MARKKIMDELRCAACDKKLSRRQPLYETAWSGLYWCGTAVCAMEIMEQECLPNEFLMDDETNWDEID